MPQEEAQKWIGKQDEPELFEVYRENWPVLQLFLAMATQWRWTGGMEPRRCGLEYAALPVVCELVGIGKKKRPGVFDRLRVMESAALNVWRDADK